MTSLDLHGRPRAQSLLTQLDRTYWDWADSLPGPLQAAAYDRSTFDGSQEKTEFKGPSSLNPGMTGTPWLFWERTSQLDDESFLTLSFAGALVVLSSMVMDHLADGQARDPARSALLARALEAQGRQKFRKSFPDGSVFWRDYQRLQADHIHSLASELEHRRSPSGLSAETFRRMVAGKFAPIAVTARAFSVVLEDSELGERAERGLRELAVGSQLLDDMGDWADDLRAEQLTFYIKGANESWDWTDRPLPSTEEVEAAIRGTMHDVRTLNETIRSLDSVLESTRSLACSAWEEYVHGYLALAEQHREIAVAGYLKPMIESEFAS